MTQLLNIYFEPSILIGVGDTGLDKMAEWGKQTSKASSSSMMYTIIKAVEYHGKRKDGSRISLS